MTLSSFTVLSSVLSLLLIGIGAVAWFWSKRPAHDAFADWLQGVKHLNPGYEPTHIMGPNGRYVPNPKWRAGQTIRHADGTQTQL